MVFAYPAGDEINNLVLAELWPIYFFPIRARLGKSPYFSTVLCSNVVVRETVTACQQNRETAPTLTEVRVQTDDPSA